MKKELAELIEEGWEKMDVGCGNDPLLKKGTERILYDIENNRITLKYSISERYN